MVSFKIIETSNVRAILNNGVYNLKALTPEAKALFRFKKIKNGDATSALTAQDVMTLITDVEGKIAKLAAI